MKKILLVCILFVNCAVFSQEFWRPIGPDDQNQPSTDAVNYSSFDLDSNNNPYVFYQNKLEFTDNAKHAYVRRYNGLKWEAVGNNEIYGNDELADTYKYHSLTLDNNNVPFIAYTKNGKVTVKKFNGNNWDFVGTDQVSADSAAFLKIQISSDNVPYVVYSNSEYSDRITVKKFNGNAWESVGSELFSAGSAKYTDIKIGTDNVVYVSYKDAVNEGKATVQKFTGTAWEIVGTPGFSMSLPLPQGNGFSANAIYYVSLALDSNNVPYVCYPGYVQKFNGTSWDYVGSQALYDNTVPIRECVLDFTTDGTPYLATQFNNYGAVSGYIDVKKFNGTAWESAGSTLSVKFEEFDVKSTSFYIGTDNVPQICYSDFDNGLKASVRKLVGANWLFTGENGFSENFASSISSDADNMGNIYTTYIDKFQVQNVKKFNGTLWEAIPSPSNPTDFPITVKISIANNNIPYSVSLHDTGSLSRANTVKKWDGTSWQQIGSDITSVHSAQIAIDNNNIPYLAFNDSTLEDAITVKRFNGTEWEVVGISGLSPSDSYVESIAIDHNNMPYVAYRTSSYEKYIKKFNGTNWVLEVAVPNDFFNSETMILRFSTDNILYNCLGNKVQKLVGNSWETLGSSDFSGIVSDFKLDSNNVPYVSLRSSDYRFSVTKFNGNDWEFVGQTDFTAATGLYRSWANESTLILKHNNIPIITYASYDAFAKYFGNETFLNSDELNYGNASIALYPNPVKDIFSISSKDIIEEILIYDVSGKKVFTEKNNGEVINIETLPSGLYFIKAQTLNGSFSKKVVKQ